MPCYTFLKVLFSLLVVYSTGVCLELYILFLKIFAVLQCFIYPQCKKMQKFLIFTHMPPCPTAQTAVLQWAHGLWHCITISNSLQCAMLYNFFVYVSEGMTNYYWEKTCTLIVYRCEIWPAGLYLIFIYGIFLAKKIRLFPLHDF